MFLRIVEKNKRFTSFLQKFIHDPLLFMQILIICLAVLALANPSYITQKTVRNTESVAIVIDASASMQATDIHPTRFSQACEKAKGIIGNMHPKTDVSIVLATSLPATAGSSVSTERAQNIIDSLEATDVPSNIGDAILLAKDMLKDSDRSKKIYVLSDFSSGGGTDIGIARGLAMMEAVEVELIGFGHRSENAAIVDFSARRSNVADDLMYVSLTVKNYKSVPHQSSIEVLANGVSVLTDQVSIDADSERFYHYQADISADGQEIEARLISEDDLSVDDVVWAYVPPIRLARVLLLTRPGSDIFMEKALESLAFVKKIEYDRGILPINLEVLDYDVIILGNIEPKMVIPRMFLDIKFHVEANGATLVVLGSNSLASLGADQINPEDSVWHMMPVDMESVSELESNMRVVLDHQVLNDIHFDSVVLKKYYRMRPRDEGTMVLAETELASDPIIAYAGRGNGSVIYMGANPDPSWSNLYYSASFPIFWNQLIGYFTKGRRAHNQRSLLTGGFIQAEQGRVITLADGRHTEDSSVFLDRAGIYKITHPERTETIPVNLLDPVESDIMPKDIKEIKKSSEFRIEYEPQDIKHYLFRHLAALLMLLLFFEASLYRRRGML